jgi:hypothetical protein
MEVAMANRKDSGKVILFKGTMSYLWEEIKTINRRKLSALRRILAGYIRMKFSDQKKITNRRGPPP